MIRSELPEISEGRFFAPKTSRLRFYFLFLKRSLTYLGGKYTLSKAGYSYSTIIKREPGGSSLTGKTSDPPFSGARKVICTICFCIWNNAYDQFYRHTSFETWSL